MVYGLRGAAELITGSGGGRDDGGSEAALDNADRGRSAEGPRSSFVHPTKAMLASDGGSRATACDHRAGGARSRVREARPTARESTAGAQRRGGPPWRARNRQVGTPRILRGTGHGLP